MRTKPAPILAKTHRRARLLLALALLLLSSCTGAADNDAPPESNTANATAANATANNGAAVVDDGSAVDEGAVIVDAPPAVVLPPPQTPADNETTAATAPTAPDTISYAPSGLVETTFGGQSAAMLVDADGIVYVVNGGAERLYFHRSTDGGQTFEEPIHLNPGAPYRPSSLDRPVILTGPGNRVTVAWLQIASMERSVTWQVTSNDGGQTFNPPRNAFEQAPQHGLLLQGATDAGTKLLFTWLQQGQLYVSSTTEGIGSLAAGRVIDDEVCDCCQPEPLVTDSAAFIAYRNLEYTADGTQYRDIYLLRSDDNGANFNPPVPVSDEHWYLDSCPSTGPAVALGPENQIYVAFTDGRLDDGSRTRSDIFFAVSEDGGQSFGPNVRMNQTDGYNRGTTIATAPDGTIHVSWQTHGGNQQAIYYAVSLDGGQSFSQPWPIVRSNDGSERGNPNTPRLMVGPDGSVHLTWTDRLGVHYATWHVN